MDWLEQLWPIFSTTMAILCASLASAHVVLHKRDVRSSAGWVGLIWLVPIIGVVLYLLLGINRIRRRAVMLRRDSPRYDDGAGGSSVDPQTLEQRLHPDGEHLARLAAAIGNVTSRKLLEGNRVEPLENGDQAYPAMLAAIESAQRTLSLSTYIFETRGVGARFVEALCRAVRRGVSVRVLIDDVGARYAVPTPSRVLRKRGIRTALFMPGLPSLKAAYLNLRNHRKIMVVDGRVGFTGGINIRNGHVLASAPRHPIRDLHFRLQGPVVSHLQQVFAEDWEFTTGERLEGDDWFPQQEQAGVTLARGIADGPDEDLDKFTWTLHAALACARRRVLVMSPYFLPDASLSTALSTAALRGVEVDVLLPAKSNLTLVQWAMWRQLEEVLGHGVRAWLTPPPFDHTKLMLVDEHWALIGSANWDTRSLRLNFELDVECYDADLCTRLYAMAAARRAHARPITRAELLARPAAARIRDGFARLLMPYL